MAVSIAGVRLDAKLLRELALDAFGFEGPGRRTLYLEFGLADERDGRLWSFTPEGRGEVQILERHTGFLATDVGPAGNQLTTRMCLARVLEPEGTLVVHASAILREGRAFLFPARSGVGKSTLARNARAPLLSDDTVILRANEAGRFEALGTPFSSRKGLNGTPIAAPLGAVCFLEQAPALRVERLPGSSALTRLLAHVFCLPRPEGLPAQVIRSALDVLAGAPAFVLAVPLGYVFDPADLGLAKEAA